MCRSCDSQGMSSYLNISWELDSVTNYGIQRRTYNDNGYCHCDNLKDNTQAYRSIYTDFCLQFLELLTGCLLHVSLFSMSSIDDTTVSYRREKISVCKYLIRQHSYGNFTNIADTMTWPHRNQPFVRSSTVSFLFWYHSAVMEGPYTVMSTTLAL